jgi:hypothetical protein
VLYINVTMRPGEVGRLRLVTIKVTKARDMGDMIVRVDKLSHHTRLLRQT